MSDPRLAEADALLATGRWAQAEALLRALQESAAGGPPDYLAALAWARARALHALGDIDGAVSVFRSHCEAREPACDPEFDAIYHAGLRATGTFPFPAGRRLRFYRLVERLDAILPLEGAIAECGCYRGLSTWVLCRYLALWDDAFDGSGFTVLDSFAGLSAPSAEDATPADMPESGDVAPMRQAGAFAASLETVRANLAGFPKLRLHPGWIPQSLASLPEARYRFVHVDVDLHAPTRACFEYFYPRLVRGGVIVCDDYNWPGARRAIDAFCAAHGLRAQTNAQHQAWLTRP